MALLFCDGFDHVDDGYELLKWDTYNSASALEYASGHGRTGGWGMKMATSAIYWMSKAFPANLATVIIGMAVKIPLGSYSTTFFSVNDGSDEQIGFLINAGGQVQVFRDVYGTILGTSNPGVIPLGKWCYFETKITIHNTTGSVEVKINGDTVLNLTNQDTQHTVNAYVNSIKISGRSDGLYIDDLYICDTSGTLNNDFLGDVKITTLYPTSDGNSSDFTPSTGVDNYALVDEPQLVGLTDYNESSTISHKDLYGVTAYAGSDTIHAVQVNPAVLNTDVGTMNVRALSRSGGTPADNEGSDVTLSQTINAASHIFEQEPTDAVAWTAAKVNAAEFGLKIQS